MQVEHINAKYTFAPPWQFNQAVKVTAGKSMIFMSGLAGHEPDGTLAEGDIVAQAKAAFRTMSKVVEAAGGTTADIVKTTVYIKEDFSEHRDELRGERSRYFTENFPASTLIQVSGFANPNYLFQVDAIAVIE